MFDASSFLQEFEMTPVKVDELTVDGSDGIDSTAEFVAKTEKAGHHCVFPAADQLQIDIDSDAHYAVFNRTIEILRRYFNVEVEQHPSMSGLPSRHITIRVPGWDLSPTQRIAWQAALGSDPVRELLSLIRYAECGDATPTLFRERGPKP